ncbi:MAG: glycosyltransferase family 2 protein [Verrucomicrobiota bacterium]
MESALVVYQVVVTLGLIFLLCHLMINLMVFRKPTGLVDSESKVTVSILIPARNEENRIPVCLESLREQTYPILEILVLDDNSQDRTVEMVNNAAAQNEKIHCLPGKALPEGWTGKAWACHQLSQVAKGDLLIFTDADTRHQRHSIAAAVETFEERKADMISFWPRQETKTFFETLVVPFVHVLLLLFLPHWMPGRWRSLGAANGQFLAFRRSAYDLIGGHEAVSGHVVEDIALSRMVKSRGMRLVNADGSNIVTCRMYESFPQIWEGFSKNLRAGCDGSFFAFAFLQMAQCIFLFLPFFWLIWSAFVRSELLGLLLMQVGLIYTIRIVLGGTVGHSWLGVLLHPLGQALELAIAFNSWRVYLSKKISWKGRVYNH